MSDTISHEGTPESQAVQFTRATSSPPVTAILSSHQPDHTDASNSTDPIQSRIDQLVRHDIYVFLYPCSPLTSF